MSEKKKDILSVALLLLIISARFYPFILFQTPLDTDTWKSYYPWHADYSVEDVKSIVHDNQTEENPWYYLVREEVKKGSFPNWNMHSNCGTPLYANHLVPIFHVPLAVSLLLPSKLVLTGCIFLMSLLGTLSFYFFLRNWKFSSYVSIFGAVAFFLSGWQIWAYPAWIMTINWIPLILLLYDRFLESNRISFACLGAFCIGELLIAGYPVFIAHFLYFFLIYILWRRFHSAFRIQMPIRKWILGVLVMILCGILISAVQNYPTYSYMKNSNRDLNSELKKLQVSEKSSIDTSIEVKKEQDNQILHSSLLKKLIFKAQIIVPGYNRALFLSKFYLGAVVFFLSIAGLFLADRKFLTMKILFILFGLLTLIPPLYEIAERIVPGWDISNITPHEIFYFLVFFLSVIGLDSIIKSEKRNIILVLLAIFTLILQFLIFKMPTFQSYFPPPMAYRWNSSTDMAVRVIISSLSSFVLIILGLRCLCRRYKAESGIAGMIMFILSMFIAHLYIFPYFADKDPTPFNSEMKAIQETCDKGRILRFGELDIGSRLVSEVQDYILPPNLPVKYGMNDVFGYDSMMIGRYRHFMDTAAPGVVTFDRFMLTLKDINYVFPDGFLVQSTHLKYILAKDEPEMEMAFGPPSYDGAIQIYDTGNEFTSIYRVVTEYEILDDYHRNFLTDDFTGKVLLEKIPVLPDGRILESKSSGTGSRVMIEELVRENNRLSVEIASSQDCLLYISEAYYPDWKAYLDGKKVEILPANLAFRAIAIPKGRHVLNQVYPGNSVLAGGLISIIGLLAVMALTFTEFRNLKKRKK
jgi:hypothetical protein